MTTQETKDSKQRSAGFTIIELLIAMAVGSLVLMMLMQMVVMNVTAKRYFEYENAVTQQSLLITDLIKKNLNELQPHRLDLTVDTASQKVVEFTHEYDIVLLGGAVAKQLSGLAPDQLVYDGTADTLTYNGVLLHAANVKITAATFSVDYFTDTNPDPLTCNDIDDQPICGDGVLIMTLTVAFEINGNLQEERTFTTHIVV